MFPRAAGRRGALLAGCTLALAGCVAVEGGAAEVRWDIRRPGGAITCAQAGVARVRLRVVRSTGGGDLCGGRDDCAFACAARVGTTRFFIPDGRYAMSIEALDAAGKPLTPVQGVAVPPPLTRDVRRGEITDLGVHLIQLTR